MALTLADPGPKSPQDGAAIRRIDGWLLLLRVETSRRDDSVSASALDLPPLALAEIL